MKPQEDIGSLIKTKLQSVEKASNEPTWEKIQHSLEERKKKRRFAFYIKTGLAVLLLMISALFMFNYVNTSTESTITSKEEPLLKTDNQDLVIKKEKETTEVAIPTTTISKNNTIESLGANSNQNQEKITETTTTQNSEDLDLKTKSEHVEDKTEAITMTSKSKENSSQTNVSKEASKNSIALDTVVNRNDVPVTQTTQKIYYYYNSKNGQEMSSTNKKVIDSIVKMNQKKQDSLNIKN
jgi:hypothetical protein